MLIHMSIFTKNQEEFENTKGVIRIRKSKDRQHNGQKKKDKRTNNDIQYTAHKTKNRVTRTPLKLRCSRSSSSSCSTSGTRVNLATNPVISHEWGKDRKVFTTSGKYLWSFVTPMLSINRIFDSDILCQCNTVMTRYCPLIYLLFKSYMVELFPWY